MRARFCAIRQCPLALSTQFALIESESFELFDRVFFFWFYHRFHLGISRSKSRSKQSNRELRNVNKPNGMWFTWSQTEHSEWESTFANQKVDLAVVLSKRSLKQVYVTAAGEYNDNRAFVRNSTDQWLDRWRLISLSFSVVDYLKSKHSRDFVQADFYFWHFFSFQKSITIFIWSSKLNQSFRNWFEFQPKTKQFWSNSF